MKKIINNIMKAILILFAFIVCFLFIIRGEEIVLETQIRFNCWNDYNEAFVFQYVTIDNDNKNVSINYKYKETKENHLTEMRDVYENITEMLFDNSDNKYYEYTIEISFESTPKPQSFSIRNITNDKNNISIWSGLGMDSNASIRELAELCPNVSGLAVSKLDYVSLEEFAMFDDLESVYCMHSEITNEEQEYILTLFPECEIDWYGNDN